jgi:hypothetical protein
MGEEISGVSDPFDGLIDEVRISIVVRFYGWVRTTYLNLGARIRRPDFRGQRKTIDVGSMPDVTMARTNASDTDPRECHW